MAVGAVCLTKPHHIVILRFSEVVKDHAKQGKSAVDLLTSPGVFASVRSALYLLQSFSSDLSSQSSWSSQTQERGIHSPLWDLQVHSSDPQGLPTNE